MFAVVIAITKAFPSGDTKTPSEPLPENESVYIKSSAPDAKPIERKDKVTEERKGFRTSHHIPDSLKYALHKGEKKVNVWKETADAHNKKKYKREAQKSPAPAPAGAIQLDINKLLAQ